MFTDEHRRIVWDQIRQHDLRAFADILRPESFAEAAKMATGAGGRINLAGTPLCVVNLVWLGIASALHRHGPRAGRKGGAAGGGEEKAKPANARGTTPMDKTPRP